jgi:hypothetical protein
MKKIFLSLLIIGLGLPAFSQADKDTTTLLGMAGDNLDLYAVLTLFQKSKTIEAFEKSLNDPKEKINNLDLNLDKNIDFIKVVTKKDGEAYTFVLQVDISKTETQDVAIILLNKDKNKKISLQMVGDKDLYGEDYVIEPKGNSSITANPGYTGADPVTVNVPAPTTTVVVVESAPIVQYVYSPAYVPYYPPYYYGFYPPYFAMSACIAVGIYRSTCWGYHGGYYGGHYGGNINVVINTGNWNQVSHYNNSRNTSNTVANNKAKGTYGDNRGASSASTRDANRGNASTRDGNRGASASTRDGNGASSRDANRASASTRDANRGSSSSNWGSGGSSSRQSSSMGSSRNMSSGSSFGGGGSSRGGGSMSRGGGGGGRRR